MASMADVRIVARGDARLCWQPGPPPALSASQQRAVDDAWERGAARLGAALYEAPLLIYQGHQTTDGVTTLHGVYQSYRYYYAQCQLGDVGVRIDPIGVSGLLVFEEAGRRVVALGRRGATMAQYPGCWECVPSGGVDDSQARPDGTVDFAAMLSHEFAEEVCLPMDRIRRVQPFAVIYDRIACTYDICCVLHAATGRTELEAAMRQSHEYSEVLLVAEEELEDRLRQLGEGLIPLSRAILELYLETNGFA